MIGGLNTPRTERRARSDVFPASPRGERRGFQIGPRIRIGGTLGHLGQEAKIGVGKLDKMAAPFVSLIPGVGPIIGGAMNLAGHAYDTSDGGLHMNNIGKVGLESALMAGGGKFLGSALGSKLGSIPGVGGFLNTAKGELGNLPGVSQVEGFLHDHPGVGQFFGNIKNDLTGNGQGGGLGGLLGDAKNFLTGNGGANALGVAGAINAAMLQSKANDYAKNALGMMQQSYDQRAPLRTGGMQAMQSALAANPFSGTAMPQRQPTALGTAPPPAAPRPVTLGGY